LLPLLPFYPLAFSVHALPKNFFDVTLFRLFMHNLSFLGEALSLCAMGDCPWGRSFHLAPFFTDAAAMISPILDCSPLLCLWTTPEISSLTKAPSPLQALFRAPHSDGDAFFLFLRI